jgi:iron complex transport system permease protein
VGKTVTLRTSARSLSLLLAAVVAVAALLHLGFALERPGFVDTCRSLLHALGVGEGDPLRDYTVVQVRLPRLLVALAGGASLAIAGTVMQASFRNPLAAPDIVGTTAGAALGGAIAIVARLAERSSLAVPAASLLGATLVTWLVFALAGTRQRFSVAGLLLAGVALNTLFGALTSFVVTKSFGNFSASGDVLFWLMGGLSWRTWEHAAITVGGLLVFAAAIGTRVRELDVLTLGDDSALSLGVDVTQARRWLLWFAAGITATTVASTGGIAFLGLVVPHLARLLVGPAHRRLLPVAALLGSALLVAADLACRNVPAQWNLPLGVVTGLIGAPYFLFLLHRHRRGEELR